MARSRCRAKQAASMVALSLASGANATYWTATTYYAVSFSTTIIGTYTDVFTSTFYVKQGATPTGTPLSTSSDIYASEDLTLLYEWVSTDSVNSSDLLTPDQALATIDLNSNAATEYFVPRVYTAPSSCKTPFTVTTEIEVFVPNYVTDQLKPTKTDASVNSLNKDQPYTYFSMYLTPGAVPTSTSDDYIYSIYISNCENPTATGADYFNGASHTFSYPTQTPGSYSSGGGGNSNPLDNTTVCSLLTGCTSFRVWVVVVASVIPALFVLGFLESYLWYRRLFHGKGALRTGTVCWILISLWMLCFTRRQDARSPADQILLKQNWKAMSAGQKWMNWWRWGFRHSYPVALLGDPKTGGVPPLRNAQGQPMAQNGQLPDGYPGGPPPPGAPGAMAEVSGDGNQYGLWAQQKDQAVSSVQSYGQPNYAAAPWDPNHPRASQQQQQQGYFQAQLAGAEADGTPVAIQHETSEADSKPISPPIYEAPADSISPAQSHPSQQASPSPVTAGLDDQSPTLGHQNLIVSPVSESGHMQGFGHALGEGQQQMFEAPDGTVHHVTTPPPQEQQQPQPQPPAS